ncbi:MAG: hypothetical protein ACHQT8_04625 [Chlamydiales bacterium]
MAGIGLTGSSPSVFASPTSPLNHDEMLTAYFGEAQNGADTQAIQEQVNMLAAHDSSDSERGSRPASRLSGHQTPKSGHETPKFESQHDLATISEQQLAHAMQAPKTNILPTSPFAFPRMLSRRKSSSNEPIDQESLLKAATAAARLFAEYFKGLRGKERIIDVCKQLINNTVRPEDLTNEQLDLFEKTLTLGFVGRLQNAKDFVVEIGPMPGASLGARIDPLIKTAMKVCGLKFTLIAPSLLKVFVTRLDAIRIGRDSDNGNDHKSNTMRDTPPSPAQTPLQLSSHPKLPGSALSASGNNGESGTTAMGTGHSRRKSSVTFLPLIATPKNQQESPGFPSSATEWDQDTGLRIILEHQLLRKGRKLAARTSSASYQLNEAGLRAAQSAEAITKKLKALNKKSSSDQKYSHFKLILLGLLSKDLTQKSELLVRLVSDPSVNCAAKMAELPTHLSDDAWFFITREEVVLVKPDSSPSVHAMNTDRKDPVTMQGFVPISGTYEYKESTSKT